MSDLGPLQNKDLPCWSNRADASDPLCSSAVDHPAPCPTTQPLPKGSCDALIRRLSRIDHSGHEARRTDFTLEALSLKDLRQLHKDLAKAISTYEDRHKAEARAKLDAIAKEMGYSLADLIGTEVEPTRTPAAAKYRHPENPSFTWSGRGRKPLWFVAALDAGKTPEDLAIS